MFKVNEIIHLYVNLSVLKIQIENKHVAAMDCFTLFFLVIVGLCQLKTIRKKKKKMIIRAN